MGPKVIGILETEDLKLSRGMNVSIAARIGPGDASWLSCPCTGGTQGVHSNWSRGDVSTRNKIRRRWRLFNGTWTACEKVAAHVSRLGARIFINTNLINAHYTDHSRRMTMFFTFLRLLRYFNASKIHRNILKNP
jgi:hypothetical protein